MVAARFRGGGVGGWVRGKIGIYLIHFQNNLLLLFMFTLNKYSTVNVFKTVSVVYKVGQTDIF